MTRATPRTSLTRSRLTRVLADLALTAPAEARQDFAERLGQWLDVTDAITLSAAMPAPAAATPGAAASHAAQAEALAAELEQVRTALARAIQTGLPAHLLKPGADARPAYAPYHRHYQTQQRQMEISIAPLRAKARKALAAASPRLKQLAILDATLEPILAPQERKCLASLPQRLEKRFAQVHASAAGEDPALPLARFCQDMQEVLQGELETRLEPVAGLIDAFRQEASHA